ncbi:hypothetical protein Tco_1386061 [Tanacetum coccineum]
MSKHKWIYVTPSHTKKIFANMKREGKGFSRIITHLIPTMMVQALEDMGEDSVAHTDSHSTPIITQPSSSKLKEKIRRKQKRTVVVLQSLSYEATNESTYIYQLLVIHLKVVLDLEEAKTAQAKEDCCLKTERGSSNKGGKIADLDLMQSTFGKKLLAEKEVAEKETLIEIKAAKPKVVTTTATTTTTTRPKARGVVFQEPSEFKTTSSPSQASQLPQAKDKGKGKMWVDSFIPMDSEVVEGSKSQAEGSKKRTREELESDNSKKQKIDESVEAEVDDEAEIKRLMEIVPDDEVAIDAIPLATKSPVIVDWKIIKEGKMGYFQIIRADGSSRRYSSMIRTLQNIDREDLETLLKLIKAKYGNTRPKEAYERVL